MSEKSPEKSEEKTPEYYQERAMESYLSLDPEKAVGDFDNDERRRLELWAGAIERGPASAEREHILGWMYAELALSRRNNPDHGIAEAAAQIDAEPYFERAEQTLKAAAEYPEITPVQKLYYQNEHAGIGVLREAYGDTKSSQSFKDAQNTYSAQIRRSAKEVDEHFTQKDMVEITPELPAITTLALFPLISRANSGLEITLIPSSPRHKRAKREDRQDFYMWDEKAQNLKSVKLGKEAGNTDIFIPSALFSAPYEGVTHSPEDPLASLRFVEKQHTANALSEEKRKQAVGAGKYHDNIASWIVKNARHHRGEDVDVLSDFLQTNEWIFNNDFAEDEREFAIKHEEILARMSPDEAEEKAREVEEGFLEAASEYGDSQTEVRFEDAHMYYRLIFMAQTATMYELPHYEHDEQFVQQSITAYKEQLFELADEVKDVRRKMMDEKETDYTKHAEFLDSLLQEIAFILYVMDDNSTLAAPDMIREQVRSSDPSHIRVWPKTEHGFTHEVHGRIQKGDTDEGALRARYAGVVKANFEKIFGKAKGQEATAQPALDALQAKMENPESVPKKQRRVLGDLRKRAPEEIGRAHEINR